jgi:threonine dehydratase
VDSLPVRNAISRQLYCCCTKVSELIGVCRLCSGAALAVKTLRPSVHVVGVEPENVASFQAALANGAPVYEYKDPTLADGLAVPIVGDIAFEVAKDYVDSCCSVSEKMIAIAMLRLIEMEKVVVEGGGASALASIIPGGPLFRKFKGKTVCVILGGGNIDTTLLGRVIERGLAADQRLVRFTVTVSDRPGGIANLTRLIADSGASVKVRCS